MLLGGRQFRQPTRYTGLQCDASYAMGNGLALERIQLNHTEIKEGTPGIHLNRCNIEFSLSTNDLMLLLALESSPQFRKPSSTKGFIGIDFESYKPVAVQAQSVNSLIIRGVHRDTVTLVDMVLYNVFARR